MILYIEMKTNLFRICFININFSGTHCMDLMVASESDSNWLTEQRRKEVEIMHGWIKQYHADIDALGH